VLIGLWQAASSSGLLPPLFMPSPAAIVRALHRLWLDGTLMEHVTASLGASSRAGSSAPLPASPSGSPWDLLVGTGGRPAHRVGAVPDPKIALLPVLILWLGIGEPSKVATIALGVFFPTVISAYSACDRCRAISSAWARASACRRATSWPRSCCPAPCRHPGGLPHLRLGGAAAGGRAEMIGAQHGIGAFVLTAGNLMQTDQLLAAS
jgi:NitT/TauT family transport system permease protein